MVHVGLVVVGAVVAAGLVLGLTPVEQQVAQLEVILAGMQVGFVTNPTSVDEKMNFLPDLLTLNTSNKFNVSCFFAPEHGLRGDRQAGQEVDDYIDPLTQRWVYSVYGERYAPTDEQLAPLDALLFDIQDIGTRFYTYIWTMTYCMEAAGKNNKTFVVLDRPNPIGANVVQGPPNTMDCGLIGRKWPDQPWGVATRHGMTVGEVAYLVNEAWTSQKANLIVVKIPEYTRDAKWESLGRPWVLPSPNMPTLDTAKVYPGFGIFEDTDISEGRGTTRPFEIIGDPCTSDPVQNNDLYQLLLSESLPGTLFRSAYFIPTFSKWTNIQCGGVQTYISSIEFDAVRTAMVVLKAYLSLYPTNVTIDDSIDTKTGIENFHELIWTKSVNEIAQSWQSDLTAFMSLRKKYLLYN
ncbi:Pseudouridine synthase, catalytic domain [Pelomyxa schiedti]|nr:Pseudouridine synthase, catalytic domain [Pelomyxa schiedti]